MNFPHDLTVGKLIKRYKRFLADVQLETGELVVAHCANSGSMKGCAEPGSTVYLSPNDNPKAKLDWRWELVDVGTSLVGINTSRPNAIVEEAIRAGAISELSGYASLRREVKYGENGRSRIDILLSEPEEEAMAERVFVEVKNVTLADGDCALFPDAVTARGEKHLRELMAEVDAGNRAVMLYMVNRSDCTRMQPAWNIDPVYASRMVEAARHGVELLAYVCSVTPKGISPSHRIPIDLVAPGG